MSSQSPDFISVASFARRRLADEAAQRFAALAVIGHGDPRREEARQHLSPTVERLATPGRVDVESPAI